MSDSTETVRGSFAVSGIEVTKLPDKKTYRTHETYDGTGMEVTVSLKVNIFDPDVAVTRLLSAGEYEVKYDFGNAGTAEITVVCRWNGAVYTDSFDVEVEESKTGGTDHSSGGGSQISSDMSLPAGPWMAGSQTAMANGII